MPLYSVDLFLQPNFNQPLLTNDEKIQFNSLLTEFEDIFGASTKPTRDVTNYNNW